MQLVVQDKDAQELREYNSASLATQAKLGKHCHEAKN